MTTREEQAGQTAHGRTSDQQLPAIVHDAPWLHLYTQERWHDDAAIVGTRAGLSALRDALDVALATGDGHAECELFANDGEGYQLTVVAIDYERMETMALPYTDDVARETRSAAIWPDDLARTTPRA